MELMQAIHSRKSIRKFKDAPIPDEVLLSMVKAAVQAPSASCVQAWRFILVSDPAVVRKIKLFSPGMGGNPAALIAVCSDRAYAQKRGGESASKVLAVLDAAYASENIMLAALEYGLGTCAVKSYNDAAVRQILELPENVVLELVITVGYPDQDLPKPARRPMEEVVFQNKWGKNL